MSKLFQALRQFKSQGIEGYFAIKYAEFAQNTEEMQKEYSRLADKVTSVVHEGKLLEIGPGPGYVSIYIAKILSEIKIIGLDISDAMIEIAKKNTNKYGLSKRIEFRKGDASKMPFQDSSFDFVISSGSLHHWAKPVEVFNEIYRVLKPGCKALISDLRKDAAKEKIEECLTSTKCEDEIIEVSGHKALKQVFSPENQTIISGNYVGVQIPRNEWVYTLETYLFSQDKERCAQEFNKFLENVSIK